MFCIPEGPGSWKNNHYFLLAEDEGEILFSTKKSRVRVTLDPLVRA